MIMKIFRLCSWILTRAYTAERNYSHLKSVLSAIKSQLLGKKCVSKHQVMQMFGLKFNKYRGNFYPLEAVCRGSKTQLKVGRNLNYLI